MRYIISWRLFESGVKCFVNPYGGVSLYYFFSTSVSMSVVRLSIFLFARMNGNPFSDEVAGKLSASVSSLTKILSN